LKKSFIILLIGILAVTSVRATHNRAGEITLVQINDLTYEILIQTFTYSRSAADRDELDVQWGDGTTSVADRFYKVQLPNLYFHNKYKITHTFPGPGTYTIVVQDPNRNYGVLNIPNSVNVIFSIKTTIAINPDKVGIVMSLNFKPRRGHNFLSADQVAVAGFIMKQVQPVRIGKDLGIKECVEVARII